MYLSKFAAHNPNGMILRIFAFIALLFSTPSLYSQCPDLMNNTSVTGCPSGMCEVCGTDNIEITVNDPNLPNGAVDWYSSTNPGFDPLTEGTLIGSSTISGSGAACDQCPEILSILIDACGPSSNEDNNEFMIISSGSGFNVSDLILNYPFAGPGQDADVFTGSTCQWQAGDVTSFSGCADLVAPNAGDFIPPNSYVILQTSTFQNEVYDVSSLCGLADCIYVLESSCDRNTAAFKNYEAGNSGTRTTTLGLTCGCSDAVTYTVDDPDFGAAGGDATFITGDGVFGNNGCNNGPDISALTPFAFSSVTDDFQYSFPNADCNTTQYIRGVLNSSDYSEECCGEQITFLYTFEISCPEATLELNESGDLCPGDCVEVDVLFNGGISPYSLDLQLNLVIPISGTIGSFPFGEKITICYDTGGPIIDPSNYTINVPSIAAGQTAGLILQEFSDDSGCMGIVNGGAINITFNPGTDAVIPPTQEACNNGFGFGEFDLNPIANIINGGSGEPVNFYSDIDATLPIVSPYTTGTTTIYAQIEGTPCDSEIIPVELEVIDNGDAGIVSLFCGASSEISCTICDDDGTPGENIDLSIFFDSPGVNYDYEIQWTEDSGDTDIITGSSNAGVVTFPFTITETTTFEVISVTEEGECPDETDLGDVVTISYSIAPEVDEPQDAETCGEYILPNITGTNIPANAAYFDQPAGMGTMYMPGDAISTTTTLYLYAGIPDCEVDYSFVVTILGEASIDNPDDVTVCGSYVLPEITGTNVENANYYTGIDGSGDVLPIGTIISNTTTLYLFDPTCTSNQPTLNITITPGPVIENTLDTIVCAMYIVEDIIGTNLTGQEGYFTMSGGNGMMINVGDTITTDSIINIYDNTNGCVIDIPVQIIVNPTPNSGQDSLVTLCEEESNLININDYLVDPDTTGSWNDINNTGLILDSTMVDFSGLAIGTYLFEYAISDTICFDTSSLLTLNIVGAADAGNDVQLSFCGDTMGINLYTTLGTNDFSGDFYDENFNLINYPDPTSVDIVVNGPGTDEIYYIVGDPGSDCGVDTSLITLTYSDGNEAGSDNTYLSCMNEFVILTDLLNGNNSNGMFIDPQGTGALTTANFNTALVPNGDYNILFVVSNTMDCPPDTAVFTITVSDAPNAGNNQNISICDDGTINLLNYIDGDNGGTFYENDIALNDPNIPLNGEGVFNYEYIVGGNGCPMDTSQITIVKNQFSSGYGFSISDENVCSGSCTTIELVYPVTSNNATLYYSISNQDQSDTYSSNVIFDNATSSQQITLCVTNGNLADDELNENEVYTISIDSVVVANSMCSYIIGNQLTVNTFENATGILTGTYCLDSEVMVGGDVYNQGNPTGTSILPNASVNGCDSIVAVSLVFEDQAIGNFEATLCNGDSILVVDTYFYTDDPTGEVLIANGSVNGCDSLIQVDLSVVNSTSSNLTETICFGDTITYFGSQFFEGNLSGEVIVPGGNANGCDSFLMVNISIVEPVYTFSNGSVCENFSIDINGTTYDVDNPSGVEIYTGQAANGCDSIVEVDFVFDLPAIDSTFTFTTCDDSYFIVVGNEVFNRDNPSGQVMLSAGDQTTCDTTLTIDIEYGVMEIMYMEVDPQCESVDSGYIVIEEINGQFPYTILYNGNSAIAYTLPVEIPLASGTGTITIQDNGQCETMLDYFIDESFIDDVSLSYNGSSISVNGGVPDSIFWTPEDGLSCYDCPNPIATPDVTTLYTAEMYFDSCLVIEEIEIEVIDDTPDVSYPNIFSPNGDGINDRFYITMKDGIDKIPASMTVFDRWGNKVFFNADPESLMNDGWDGTFEGSELVPGVYVFDITILNTNGNVEHIVGDITIVR